MQRARLRLPVAAFLCLGIAAAWGRGDEKPAGGNTPSLAKSTRELRQGIFLIGYRNGAIEGHGTGWVLSRKHRLLVTNAHVADMQYTARPGPLLAKMNGSDQVWTVTRVWYHPGVRRYPTLDQCLAVRSSDTRWQVCPTSPDVAVLQLGASGPELPVELAMAPPAVVFDVQALPVAMLGFPGHDTTSWSRVKKAQATFYEGVVSRTSDYNLDGGADMRYAQLLQYSMNSYGGSSGAPVYLTNGQVIGVHNMVRTMSAQDTRMIAHGIRIDAVWELLCHHQLDKLVPVPLAKSELLLKRFSDPDPNLALYRKIDGLIQQANSLCFTHQDHLKAAERYTEVLKAYPWYGHALSLRSTCYNNYQSIHASQLSAQARLDYLSKARTDLKAYLDRVRVPAPAGELLNLALLESNVGAITGDRGKFEQALTILNNLLARSLNPMDRAMALSHKGQCLFNLYKDEEARTSYNQSVAVNPDEPAVWHNRAGFWAANKNAILAASDRKMADDLRRKARLLERGARREFKVILNERDRLEAGSDKDERGCFQKGVSVQLKAGYFYEIKLSNPEFRSNKDFDPLLRLWDAQGNCLVEDDDGGGYPNVRIFYTPAQSGTFTLAVSSYRPGQTGPFVLTVAQIAKDG